MTDEELRRRFRTLDRVSAPDIWHEVEVRSVTTSTAPGTRLSMYTWPIAVSALAAAVVVAVMVGVVRPMLEPRIGAGVPRPSDAPFSLEDAVALGVLPGDVPGLGWGSVPPEEAADRARDSLQAELENYDAEWGEHIAERGLEGRWPAVLYDPDSRVRIVSTVSIWESARAASEALAYESERLDVRIGRPAGPLTAVPGFSEEGWCQMLEKNPSSWEIAFCFFRVGNATIDLHARAVEEPYPLDQLQELARTVAGRGTDLARTPSDGEALHTVSGEILVTSAEPVMREDIVIGCAGDGPDADIVTGTPIFVRDQATGEVLGRGALNVAADQPDQGQGCSFVYEIPLVPDAPMYRIELDGRAPAATYSQDELETAGWQVETLVLD